MSSDSKMKVGIIGSGASGLTAMKTCLEYGFEPICFEKTSEFGGLWRYKPEECEGEGSVMKSTVINTSKEMMAYSDFPPPKEYPNFMHNTRVVDYFKLYADRFHLLEHVRYCTTVQKVVRADDYEKSGKWNIVYRQGEESERTETFDAVLLCSGHHVMPYIPEFPGMEKFKGQILHSHSYKDHRGYEDKRVVVVGIGNSGGDIAVELSRLASQVFLVTRRGTWVFNRVYDHGYPLDCALITRFTECLKKLIPNVASRVAERQLNSRFDHSNFGLKPSHGVFQAHPTVNDDLPNRILCGTILVKPNIREFTETGIIFEDGSREEKIDTVILSTGYSFGFPYLEEGLIRVEENRVSLFKFMYPPALRHPTMSVIGLIQPLGSIMPISEMQCRVFCEGLTGRMKFPIAPLMEMDIKTKMREMAELYVVSRRHTIQVDYVEYVDELASMIGAKPHVRSYWLRDPKLAYALTFGPCAPYQYRLQGPHTWPGAREALLTIWDRVFFPTRTRHTSKDHRTKSDDAMKLAVLIVVAVLIYLLVSMLF